ncbi:MAG: hydantoinase B/oxoprolinase family protein [Candidatus Rokubacteria bacterium]|nr:hydantoinase B/oxoprolinase family protein [Candidatus Rokubacteria bacterium]
MSQRSHRDPVTLSVLWNRLIAIVDEASATLVRTAFSRIVTDAWDFSCALFDEDGAMIAQPTRGLPSFIGCLATAVPHLLRLFPPATLSPGDGLLTNDPWINTSQLNDMLLVTPVFYRGRIVGYAANIAHSPDVGGRLLSADARELFEEGLRLPPSRLISRGRLERTIVDIIRANVRVPDIVIGDLLAQEAANTVMGRRLVELLESEGLRDLRALSREILGRSERAMRAAIARIPDGTYESRVETDGFDAPLEIRARVTVAGDEIAVDFTGTSPQQEMGINCAFNYAYAETVFPLISISAPAAPVNAGSLRPLRVTAPEGTILSAVHPAPLGGRLLVSMYVQCAIFRALAPAVPEGVLADCAAPAWTPVVQGLNQYGRRFVDIIFLNGGLGARPGRDGIHTLGFPAPLGGTLVEVFENEKPMFLERRELADDTAGPGKYRGGAGLHFIIRCESAGPITVGLRADRLQHPPQGLFGGGQGVSGIVRLNGNPQHPKRTILLRAGDVLAFRTPGGGGYGDPRQRDAVKVREDVAAGLVSPDRALADYGVRVE